MKSKALLMLLFLLGLFMFALLKNHFTQDKFPMPVSEAIFQYNNGDIHYLIAGNSENTPIVFVPGWGARENDIYGRGKKAVVEKLAEQFFVISPELPGLTRSTPPKEQWGIDEYAQAVHALVQSNGVSKPVMMGQSFGGAVVTNYVHLFPGNVGALILVDASQGNRPKNEFYQKKFVWNPRFKKFIDARFVPELFKKILLNAYLGVPFATLEKRDVNDYKVMMDIEMNFSDTIRSNYKDIIVPTMLLYGKKDTKMTPIERAREIAVELPLGKMVEIDGGHLALYMNMKTAMKEINSFIFSSELLQSLR